MRPRFTYFLALPVAVTLAAAGIAAAQAAPDPATTDHTTTQGAMADEAMTHLAGSTAAVAVDKDSRTPDRGTRDRRPQRSAALPVLRGTVGPGFTIDIDDHRVPKGKYKFVIEDLSSIHNFHINGKEVDQATSVEAVETVTWRIRLRKDTYEIFCDPHQSSMSTTLKVFRPA